MVACNFQFFTRAVRTRSEKNRPSPAFLASINCESNLYTSESVLAQIVR
ncbi:MAG: hypothetical protein Q8P67_22480 [archaeon]|nr:hypothetical protein [archaeon]